eukprot:4559829-Amphidinium_carterae.1
MPAGNCTEYACHSRMHCEMPAHHQDLAARCITTSATEEGIMESPEATASTVHQRSSCRGR